MSIMESLRKYFSGCPLLDENGKIGVDFLGNTSVEYVLETVPAEPIVKRYADGGSIRQYVFTFASREAYGADALNNLCNCGFYAALAEWLEKQNNSKIFPALPDSLTPISIVVTTHGYLFDAGPDTGRYQIQCNLTYYQEA